MLAETVEQSNVAIHPFLRYFTSPNRASGCLVTGTDKVRSGYGNGDCLLADFDCMVFAVADATERFSHSSRQFLHRLVDHLHDRGRPADAMGWDDCFSMIYASQEYRQKTTATVVAITIHDDHHFLCHVMSGGDSGVAIIDAEGKEKYRSKVNMYFAGRSPNAAPVETIVLPREGARIFMYTDGFSDVHRRIFRDTESGFIPNEFMSLPVDAIAPFLVDTLTSHEHAFEHDDIALAAIDVNRALASSTGGCLLLGGTTPAQEKKFRALGNAIGDRLLGSTEWADTSDLINDAGFSIVNPGE